MENGAGYNRFPGECDKYFQCYFDKNGQVTAFYRNCPWGQFWNQEILSCQPPKNVKCENGKYNIQCTNNMYHWIYSKNYLPSSKKKEKSESFTSCLHDNSNTFQNQLRFVFQRSNYLRYQEFFLKSNTISKWCSRRLTVIRRVLQLEQVLLTVPELTPGFVGFVLLNPSFHV